jgi:hypothetical protein
VTADKKKKLSRSPVGIIDLKVERGASSRRVERSES